MQHVIIAIDGPAASGKSSVARFLAGRLGFVYVNTGEIYRALTWFLLRAGVAVGDHDAVRARLAGACLECTIEDGRSVVRVQGHDPGAELVQPEVTAAVSAVASIPEVRAVLLQLQRDFAHRCDAVMEGRDIGSVVFPDTPYKFYVDASEEVRAARRARQGLEDVIAQRDRLDSTRKIAPLVVPAGACRIDSSDMTVEQVAGEILSRLNASGFAPTQTAGAARP
jgi:cytidylate kinase